MMKNQAKLLALVGVVFFPFIAKVLLKDDSYSLKEEERKFVYFYIGIGWLILLLLFISFVVYFIGLYYDLPLFSLLFKIFFLFSFIILFWALFGIFSEKKISLYFDNIFFATYQTTKFDFLVLLSYLPFVNLYLFLFTPSDKTTVLKEGIVFYLVLFLVGFLGFTNLFYVLLILGIIRLVSLYFGIDFYFISNFTNKIYKTKPWDILAYVEAGFYYLFNNFLRVLKGQQAISYLVYVNQIQDFYGKCFGLNIVLKKWKKYLFITISYAFFLGLLFYKFYFLFTSWLDLVVLISTIGLACYLLFPLFKKRLCPIPFFSLLIFYILRKF